MMTHGHNNRSTMWNVMIYLTSNHQYYIYNDIISRTSETSNICKMYMHQQKINEYSLQENVQDAGLLFG